MSEPMPVSIPYRYGKRVAFGKSAEFAEKYVSIPYRYGKLPVLQMVVKMKTVCLNSL